MRYRVPVFPTPLLQGVRKTRSKESPGKGLQGGARRRRGEKGGNAQRQRVSPEAKGTEVSFKEMVVKDASFFKRYGRRNFFNTEPW
jgi:hypothetical protein